MKNGCLARLFHECTGGVGICAGRRGALENFCKKHFNCFSAKAEREGGAKSGAMPKIASPQGCKALAEGDRTQTGFAPAPKACMLRHRSCLPTRVLGQSC